MTILETIFLASSVAFGLQLSDLRKARDYAPLGTVSSTEGNGIKLELDPAVLNITVSQIEGPRLTSFGEPIDIGDKVLEYALCEYGHVRSYDNQAAHWCAMQIPSNQGFEKNYEMKPVRSAIQKDVTFGGPLSSTVTAESLFGGVSLLCNGWTEREQIPSRKAIGICSNAGVARIGEHELPKSLEKGYIDGLVDVYNEPIVAPVESGCFFISTQDNSRGWTFAYGMDREKVENADCTVYAAQELRYSVKVGKAGHLSIVRHLAHKISSLFL